jgi:hypothetical protein
MNHRYRIAPKGRASEPSDAELGRYRDSGKLLYNYQRARDSLYRRPLYRDPKAFLVLLLIVLLAWLLSRPADRLPDQGPPAPEQRP